MVYYIYSIYLIEHLVHFSKLFILYKQYKSKIILTTTTYNFKNSINGIIYDFEEIS